jgi:hypothetical protein
VTACALLVVLILVCSGLAAQADLSGTALKKQANAICTWKQFELLSEVAALPGTPGKNETAGQLARILGTAIAIARHQDTGLSALHGPPGYDKEIKALVADNAKMLTVENKARMHFEAGAPHRKVSLDEEGRYMDAVFRSENPAQLLIGEDALLPQSCAPAL